MIPFCRLLGELGIVVAIVSWILCFVEPVFCLGVPIGWVLWLAGSLLSARVEGYWREQ